jgi:hypothetical protein
VICDYSSSSESDDNEIETIQVLNNKNPYLKLKMIGKIKKKVEEFINKENKTMIDENLLKNIIKKKGETKRILKTINQTFKKASFKKVTAFVEN